MFGSSKKFTFDDSDLTASKPSAPEIPMSHSDEEAKRVGRRMQRSAARIDLDRIVTEEQVRKDLDEAHVKELSESIRLHGLQQPIRVRWDQDAEGGAGRYVVISGHCRLAAHHLAGMEAIDCMVEEQDLKASEISERQLIENIVRQKLNPIDEANGFRRIMDDREGEGRPTNAKELAAEIGLSHTKVTRSLRLLKLPEDIQAEVAAGDVPPSVIREVMTLKSEDEQRKLIEAYKTGGSYGTIAAAAKQKKTGKTPVKSAAKKKIFTHGKLKLQASGKSRISSAELMEALEAWQTEIKTDGRVKLADAA